MRNIYPLFSIPIFSNKINIFLQDEKFISNQKTEILEPVKNGLISLDKYVLNKKQLINLKKDILKEVYFYVYEILNVNKNIKTYINNSWIIFHENNHSSQAHHHSNSFISGVLYFKTPVNSGNIVFHNPYNRYSLNPVLNIPFEKWNQYNSNTWTMPIEKNQLLLFPSNLFHSVENNQNSETRICLAFNILIKGDLSDTEIGQFKL